MSRSKNINANHAIVHDPFIPCAGLIYTNHNGSRYQCISANGDEAVFINTESGWLFTAHHLVMYSDRTIEWDYSTGGHFFKEGLPC